MTTEMITVKMEDVFLDEIDAIVKSKGYKNRTEFIRSALREKIDRSKLNAALIEISNLKGASKKKTDNNILESIRSAVFDEFGNKFR